MLYDYSQPLFRSEYNGCKSTGCPNCGISDLTRYQPSTRLGYAAYHCPLCDAYPPVLLNEPIQALNQQITQSHFQPAKWLTLVCDCQPYFAESYWTRYGQTKAGSKRFKCQQCGTVKTAVNSKKYQATLQPWLDALFEGDTPAQLQAKLGLNSKLFYQRLIQMSELLEACSRRFEQQYFGAFSDLTLQTRSHILNCRSGLTTPLSKQNESSKQNELSKPNELSKSTHLWLLSTAESHSGYQLLITHNLLDKNQLAAFPLAQQGQYKLETKEAEITQTNQVLLRAERTYQKILARSQFDQLAYADAKYSQHSDGVLLRPVYAAHSHMQHLKYLLKNTNSLFLLLEHESFLRGSAIFTFMPESVITPKINLFYIHTHQHKKMKNTQVKSRKFSAKNSENPLVKSLSWWQEKWLGFEHDYAGKYWSVGIGSLTRKPEITQQKIQTLVTTQPNWQEDFWLAFDEWLPYEQRNKMSSKYLFHWLNIFRFIHNRSCDLSNLISVNQASPFDRKSIEELIEYQAVFY
ncbi:MAG: hypothetical protein ACK5NC_02940 [Vibrio sp.]